MANGLSNALGVRINPLDVIKKGKYYVVRNPLVGKGQSELIHCMLDPNNNNKIFIQDEMFVAFQSWLRS